MRKTAIAGMTVLATAGLLHGPAAVAKDAPFSLCAIDSGGDAYDGKTVTVEAEFRGNWEYAGLSDPACPKLWVPVRFAEDQPNTGRAFLKAWYDPAHLNMIRTYRLRFTATVRRVDTPLNPKFPAVLHLEADAAKVTAFRLVAEE